MNAVLNFLALRLPFGPLSFQLGPALAGLLAALIPLIIHLSRSRRTKKMRFSTTRFFTDQFLRSYRMSRIREVLLLACRMALFALLGFGLAQPLLSSQAYGALQTQGPRAAVIVLDDSASMGYSEEGKTLFHRAREAAKKIVGQLRPGDTASLVLAGHRADGPQVVFPRPTDRLDDVTQAIDAAKPTDLTTDLTEAIPVAEAQARSATADGKEVYVFSDLQETSWPERPLDDNAGGPALVVVQVRPQKPVTNVGVTAVQFNSARPMAGAPFTIRPLLTIAGDRSDAVAVSLFIDGEKVGEQKVERLQSGRWAAPRFHHTFSKGGWHSGWVEVADDALPADNRRYFAVEVLQSVKVLAVDGGPSKVEREDALFFLQRALTAAPEGEKSPVELDSIPPDALADKDLSGYPLVVLADVESLQPKAVDRLEEYVAGGGSLFIFLGGRVDPAFYNDNLIGPGRRDGGLLPGRLVKRQGDPAGGKDVGFVGDVDYDHPALAAFHDPGFASLAGPAVTFKALWEVDAPPPAAVLMKASTGAPLLCEKAVGKGRVMLFTSSCDRSWTNFPIRPAYLPWARQLAAYLTEEPLGRDTFHLAGDVVALTPLGGEPSAPLRVKKPDGQYAPARWSEQDRATEFTEADHAGIYAAETADRKPVGLFAVNTESYESKLTYLDEPFASLADPDRRARVEAGLKQSRLANRPLVAFVDDAAEAAHAGGGGDPNVWVWVLLVVLAVAVAEPTLANRISALLFSKPRATPDLSPAVRPLPAGAAATPLQEASVP
jgi:hypothetical protein